MCKPIFAMVTNTKDPDKCKNVNATRIKRYTSYYIRQNGSVPYLTLWLMQGRQLNICSTTTLGTILRGAGLRSYKKTDKK